MYFKNEQKQPYLNIFKLKAKESYVHEPLNKMKYKSRKFRCITTIGAEYFLTALRYNHLKHYIISL